MITYNKAGKYVAICNTSIFDGHYVKEFEYPQSFIDKREKPAPSAAWYFLNYVDLVACVDRVYPIEIFESIEIKVSRKNQHGEYVVKVFKGGKHYEEEDYFTNDKLDAQNTAKMMREARGI